MKIERLANVHKEFRNFEKKLSKTKIPDNQANKVMSLVLGSINSFELIATRYKRNRERLKKISIEESCWIRANPNVKVRPAHPDEECVNAAIRVDVESLFIFSLILIRRTLILIKLFIPDRPQDDKFKELSNFYHWLNSSGKLSPLTRGLRERILPTLKWLYAVLRFYRNEFIEHLDKGYQQGMGYMTYGEDFSLHSYKWDFDAEDIKRIEEFKAKIVKRKIQLGKELNHRHFVQVLFDKISAVPDDLIEEALRLIEDIGVESPQPRQLINMVEQYLCELFGFMNDNFTESELARYQVISN